MKGYCGKILFVDLSEGSIEERDIPDEIYEKYLSGSGLGAYILYNNIPQNAEPLGSDNILGFVSGLLTGTGSIITGRWLAVCKSPLTGGWGDANCGGNFAPALKRCGYDGIFFQGISQNPVYLKIDDNGATLEDASHVWGKDAVTAEDILEKENRGKRKPSIAVIGEAGEKLSLISGICNDRGRIAARSGCGAVMGSKKLKAVVLDGSKKISCHNPEAVKSISRELTDKINKNELPNIVKGFMMPVVAKILNGKNVTSMDGMMQAPMFKKWGTITINQMAVVTGDSPVKNWAGSVNDYNILSHRNLNPDLIIKHQTKKYSCYSCVIACGGICSIENITGGKYSHTHKPEYETCSSFGPLLLNKDLNSIFYINELLNRAGMDSISAGNTVAFAIECYENNILTKKDTDGLNLSWGNAKAIISLIEKMIAREGIGDILADGARAAASKIASGSEKYAMHNGGQEPGMHDARFDPMIGVHYSVDPTPGRHTVGSGSFYNSMRLWEEVTWAPVVKKHPKAQEYIPSEKEALKAVAGACFKQVVDGSGGCLFAAILGVQHWKVFEWLNYTTGWDKTADEYMEIGKRIQTLRQLFNIREGINPVDFKLNRRLSGDDPLKDGPLKGLKVPIDEMMSLYWKAIGWDEKSGIPLKETVADLGLDKMW